MEADGDSVATAAPPLAMVAVLLALLCAALFWPASGYEFVGAEDRAIVDDAGIRWHVLSLAQVRAALAREQPVAQLTYGLNYRLGRLDFHGWHAFNDAIHVVNALLVYALGLALFRRSRGISGEAAPWAALAGAALFAAHPLQVEAVTWVAQRGILLAAMGSLGAVLCYLRAREASGAASVAWSAWAAACGLLAIGSRASAVALLAVIALCEWRFGFVMLASARRAWIAVGFCVAAGVIWLTVRNASALALYESLVVLPAPARLSLAHDLAGSALARGGAVALQVALLAAAVASARRRPMLSFALLWYFAVHAGEAAFAPTADAAEHRNYLALAGPALGAAYALFAGLPRRLGLATALSVFAVVALGAATHARTEVWRSPDDLWDDAVVKAPRDAAARLERAGLLDQEGRASDALDDLTEAVRLAPASAPARERLAASLAGLGRTPEALPHAREAVALDPQSAGAHAELGRILASLGELEPAAAALARALELGGAPELERRLADTLVRLGRFEASLPYYRTAIERDPGDDEARTGAGAALVELGRAREALAFLEPAVESQPNPRYLAHFADALWQLGDADGALDAAAMAVRVGSTWPGATSRFAWMLAVCPDAERRDPARALRVADAALAQAGGRDAQLVAARAAALAAAGRFAEARADAERAASLDPAFAAHAERYARRELVRDPPRPFEASP